MFYKLILRNHVDDLTETEWTFQVPALVGRDPNADVCIEHDSISRNHCQFSLSGEGALVVRDLESMNGIYVDNLRVPQATLMPHQVLQIGSIIAQVEFAEESEVRKPSSLPKGSVYVTQPMETLRRIPLEAEKPWWRRLFG